METALRTLTIAIIYAVWSTLTFAADISFLGIDKIGDCTIKLAGRIEKGDAAKLEIVLSEHSTKKEQSDSPRWPVICLNSSGGDYDEGLRLIDIISAHRDSIRTHISAGASCNSTCALIFLSGVFSHDEGAVFPWRTISAKAKRLGFNRPEDIDRSKLPAGSEFLGEEIINAYGAGVSAVVRLLERMAESESKRFPANLLVEALKREAGEPYEIDTLDEIGRWDIGLTDFVSPSRVDAKMAEQACANDDSWSFGGSSHIVETFQGPIKRGHLGGADFYIFTGYGGEGESDCLVTSKPGRPARMSIYMDSFAEPGAFETRTIEGSAATEANIEVSPMGEQAWMGLSPDTRFSSLADDR